MLESCLPGDRTPMIVAGAWVVIVIGDEGGVGRSEERLVGDADGVTAGVV